MSTPYARTKIGVVGAASVSVDLSGKAKELILSSTTDCWVNFNDAAVAEECFYLPADKPILISVSRKESLNVIQDSAGGFLSVLEQADQRLITTINKFFTSNASLLYVDATTFKANSNLLKAVSATATGDSSLATEYILTASGDSNLATEYILTALVNSNLVKNVDETFDGGSTLIT